MYLCIPPLKTITTCNCRCCRVSATRASVYIVPTPVIWLRSHPRLLFEVNGRGCSECPTPTSPASHVTPEGVATNANLCFRYRPAVSRGLAIYSLWHARQHGRLDHKHTQSHRLCAIHHLRQPPRNNARNLHVRGDLQLTFTEGALTERSRKCGARRPAWTSSLHGL